ncbi:lysophospholipase [Mycena filopes]|nr:lysophospholipase [Mycena filopes]
MAASLPYTEAWLSGPQETRFYTRTYKAETPTAVLVFSHGAAEHLARYTEMHTAIAQQGISVFTFDLRGFGRTAMDKESKSKDSAYGKTDIESQLNDMEWAIDHARTELGNFPLFIMGPSMGGAIVLGLMCDEKRATHKTVTAIRGVIAASPCVAPTHMPPQLVVGFLKILATVAPYILYPVRNQTKDLSRNPITNAQYLADPLIKTPGSIRSLAELLALGARLLSTTYVNWPKDTPVLVLHGTNDQITSYPSAEALFQKLPAKDKNMITYPGAYHELQNEPDGVREKYLADVVAFIHSHSSL